MYLVTTSLKNTWPEKNFENILFLGKWCHIYENITEKIDTDNKIIVPYHWNDRKKLLKDYQYLHTIYEKILKDLSQELNKFHSTKHTILFWRILIGPWLGCFIQILFDRWYMIEYAFQNYNITDIICIDISNNSFVPNDIEEFFNLFPNDRWNEFIYHELILRKKEIFIHNVPEEISRQTTSINKKNKSPFKYFINKIYMASSFFVKKNDFFFINTYLPPFIEFKLQLKLWQMPQKWKSETIPKFDNKNKIRNLDLGKVNNSDEFESVLRDLIPKHIPVAYLEGFESIKLQMTKLMWPMSPKVIFTSNSHYSDDLFKLWTAHKIESGSKLVIGQHGGHYGMGKWSFFDDHEFAIANKYLSWGWIKEKEENIFPIGKFSKYKLKSKKKSSNISALLVTVVHPRYSYFLYSSPVAEQWNKYFDDQFEFYKKLPNNIQSKLKVRLYSGDYGWNQRKRWKDKFPNILLSNNENEKMADLFNENSIIICTYNGTAFLESLSSNKPTLIFWDINNWELNEQAILNFNILFEVEIFHKDPISASNKLIEIWDNIDEWWYSERIQSALHTFNNIYAKNNYKLIENIKDVLIN